MAASAAGYLRYAACTADEQRAALVRIVTGSSLLVEALRRASSMALPDWWLVSGAVYNTVWNALTEREPLNGIKDIDLFYFDGGDLSYDAEDRVIQKAVTVFAGLPKPVEVRNQARVHLWFERHFGQAYSPLTCSGDGIDRFASRTHAVGVRLDANSQIEIYAPFGLGDLFSFRIAPNRLLDNRATHETKAQRALTHWPELTVEPW